MMKLVSLYLLFAAQLFLPAHAMMQAPASAPQIESQPYTNDFGVAVTEFLVSSDLKEGRGEDLRHFKVNMTDIGEKEGFAVRFSQNPIYVRDHFAWSYYAKRAPKIAYPFQSEHTELARYHSFSWSIWNEKFGTLTPRRLGNITLTGTALFDRKEADAERDNLDDTYPFNDLPFYFEGGNLLVVSNALEQRVLLIGEDAFYMAFMNMKFDNFFKQPNIAEKIKFMSASRKLSANEVEVLARQLYMLGLKKNGGKSGLLLLNNLPQFELSTQTQDIDIFQTALASKKLPSFVWDEKERAFEEKSVVQLASEILYTENALSYLFGVERVQLVPQLDYHLDTFLKTGPNASVFVQDYGLVIELCDKLLREAETLNLSSPDITILHRFREAARTEDLARKQVQEQVIAALLEVNLNVIRAPGIFADYPPLDNADAETYRLNFLNAISGKSITKPGYYYVTSGTSIGDKLGPLLMQRWEEFIAEHAPKTRVYFVGGKHGDFSETKRWWNGNEAGPHCLTFELGFHQENL